MSHHCHFAMAGRGPPACSGRRQGRANPALRLPRSNLTAAARLNSAVGRSPAGSREGLRRM